METLYVDKILKDYIKISFPIKKYKCGRRFINGIKINNRIFSLKNETRKELYFIISDDLSKTTGLPEDKYGIIILTYLKFI